MFPVKKLRWSLALLILAAAGSCEGDPGETTDVVASDTSERDADAAQGDAVQGDSGADLDVNSETDTNTDADTDAIQEDPPIETDTPDVFEDTPLDTSEEPDAEADLPVDRGHDSDVEVRFELTRLFPVGETAAPVYADCLHGSPILWEPAEGDTELILAAGDVVTGLDTETAELLWVVDLPEPEGQRAFVVGTPAIHGDRLVVGYQTRPTTQTVNVLDPSALGHPASRARAAHWVSVIDLPGQRLDPDFDLVELEATVPAAVGDETIDFWPSNAFLRSRVAWAGMTDDSLGYAYVTFGNVRDLQPWHGWAFELDMDAWLEGTADDAISAVLNTTPEADCGREGASGSLQRICGGGLWSPSGSLTVDLGDGDFDLILAPGNGQLDVERNDFANTLMRVGPGLDFDPGCSEACADFDSDSPATACMESCEDLFIPRSLPGDGPPRPESGVCDDLDFFECWQQLDYVGGSTPVYIELDEDLRVLAYPTKDGAVYLVDFDHLGTLFDRHQMVANCGTEEARCSKTWAGMAVTQPELTEVDGVPVIIVATFMNDTVHPAGIVALRVVVDEGVPQLERIWDFPRFSSEAAVVMNREGTTRIRVAESAETNIAWVVEPLASGAEGGATLRGIRVSDGTLAAQHRMVGPGYRFTRPLVYNDIVWVNSCDTNAGPGTLEGYRIDVVTD
jgi:hypothetical protein